MYQGVECPKCSRQTTIMLNANVWKCLNCDFSKDFSKDDEDDDDKKKDNTGVLTVLGGGIVTAIALLAL